MNMKEKKELQCKWCGGKVKWLTNAKVWCCVVCHMYSEKKERIKMGYIPTKKKVVGYCIFCGGRKDLMYKHIFTNERKVCEVCWNEFKEWRDRDNHVEV